MLNVNLRKYKDYKEPNPYLELFHHIEIAVSGAALVGAIARYGALIIGRDVPTALVLGSTGSLGLALNTRLREG